MPSKSDCENVLPSYELGIKSFVIWYVETLNFFYVDIHDARKAASREGTFRVLYKCVWASPHEVGISFGGSRVFQQPFFAL